MTGAMRPAAPPRAPRSWRRNLLFLVCAALVFLIVKGVLPKPAKVILTNVSAETMHAVTVQVSGRSYQIGDLMPGVVTSVEVEPEGDSHVELRFGANRRLRIDTYIAAGSGDTVIATVTPEAVVTVDTRSPATIY
ncbi:hypothetical protein [uncultured Massilia sp.]|uniref:hypothetical protein n=1 Tax=uncultured Massilia sp. TaxID=169973 RepID=UPI00258CBEA9|nr:hypothetical protein [uncultured Massilia sp.]